MPTGVLLSLLSVVLSASGRSVILEAKKRCLSGLRPSAFKAGAASSHVAFGVRAQMDRAAVGLDVSACSPPVSSQACVRLNLA